MLVKHDGTGWSVGLQSLQTMIQRGFWRQSAKFDNVSFDSDGDTRGSGYCVTEVGRTFGPLVFKRTYNWAQPVEGPGTQVARARRCETQRQRLLALSGTLAAALKTGSPEAAKHDLHAALTTGENLAVTLPEVGEPMRSKLVALTGENPRDNLAVQRLDVALAVSDGATAERWLQSSDVRTLAPYQRYAFYRLHRAAAVSRFAQAHERYSGDDERVDGFGHADFDMANARCDADYAGFLIDKGIKPTDVTVVSAFLTRMAQETPNALWTLDLDYPYASLVRRAVAYRRGGDEGSLQSAITSRACSALVAHYRGVKLPADAVTTLGDMVGAEVLTRYQNYADAQMHGRTFKTRAEEDAFYDHLQFNQTHVPLPSLPVMFEALLSGRSSGPAACAALQALPQLMDHDRGLEVFKQLAESWRGQPMPGEDALTACRPGLVFPPSYIPQQTRDQNRFLRQADIACTVTTPEGKYAYNQEISCGHE